jgi:hypothetical protein
MKVFKISFTDFNLNGGYSSYESIVKAVSHQDAESKICKLYQSAWDIYSTEIS